MKVLLTNTTRNGGMIVAQALARAGHTVVGADDRRLPFGLHSRYIARQYQTPPDGARGYADALLDIVRSERPDVLIPFAGASAVAGRRVEFLRETRTLVPDGPSLETVTNKALLPDLCAKLGVDVPQPYSREQAERAVARGDAVVVKPGNSEGAGKGLRFVKTVAALHSALDALERAEQEAVITDFVPGPTEMEHALHVLFDSESRLVAWFSLRKSIQSPLHKGITAAAVSTHDYALVQRMLPLFEHLRWQGPADVELKTDPRDGKVKLIEINGRFSGAIGFPIALGIDMANLYVRASRGERLPEAGLPVYPEGIRYINPGPYLLVLPARMREDGLRSTFRALRAECSGRVVVPAWPLRDPAPLFAKMLHRFTPRVENV